MRGAADQAALLARLERVLHAHRQRVRVRLRAQLHGEELDLDATVRTAIDLRTDQTPGDKIHQRIDHRQRGVSALLLLDTSASTADPAGDTGCTVLELAREAVMLTSLALAHAGDRCAIHGFCSNGRHEVRYESLKAFDEVLDDACIARLAGTRSRLSTRFGAGLRHATRLLAAENRGGRRLLLLLLTDGEPHDIDVHDRRYLIEDARHSVAEAARVGVSTFCVTLDSKADRYLKEIFGARGFRVLDRVEALPDVLPSIVMRLTR